MEGSRCDEVKVGFSRGAARTQARSDLKKHERKKEKKAMLLLFKKKGF